MRKLVVLVVLAAACGGGKKKGGSTTPEPDTGGGGEVANPGGTGDDMVPAEAMDEIQRLFQRKGNAVSRCLSFAIDNKDLPKNSKGRVTLGVTISKAGRADDVKIIKASIDSKSLNECILGRVKEIQFPEIPRTYETTYTYAFEAS
ncbi:MAG: AgmX/PglI C-terminal domain-containing protein [Deltaproteobacteria bacterium]|nr:AgmX/PglI C-terminal domain-containing protein [Deltaproteobacteria bacterium]MCW5805324.1 AgmX/PglI C-terminal domain-containing protein [Deltaproteobacteria bacterium]